MLHSGDVRPRPAQARAEDPGRSSDVPEREEVHGREAARGDARRGAEDVRESFFFSFSLSLSLSLSLFLVRSRLFILIFIITSSSREPFVKNLKK